MIVSRIHGGLGNQFFQYSFGRCVSALNNAPFFIDIEVFSKYKLRNYRLNHYNIAALPADAKISKRYIKFESYKLNEIYNRIANRNSYFQEKNNRFDSRYHQGKMAGYFNGYWQSEKYFKPIEDIIRKDLTLKTPISTKAEQLAAEIDAAQLPVSVHIRKTDFLLNNNANIFTAIDPSYYMQAENAILQAGENEPIFFVFSDDFEWVKKNIRFESRRVRLCQGNADYEDMLLMSRCKYNITANSTFSWWAAWLNSFAEKKIYTPQSWFNEMSDADLVPENWIRIPNK